MFATDPIIIDEILVSGSEDDGSPLIQSIETDFVSPDDESPIISSSKETSSPYESTSALQNKSTGDAISHEIIHFAYLLIVFLLVVLVRHLFTRKRRSAIVPDKLRPKCPKDRSAHLKVLQNCIEKLTSVNHSQNLPGHLMIDELAVATQTACNLACFPDHNDYENDCMGDSKVVSKSLRELHSLIQGTAGAIKDLVNTASQQQCRYLAEKAMDNVCIVQGLNNLNTTVWEATVSLEASYFSEERRRERCALRLRQAMQTFDQTQPTLRLLHHHNSNGGPSQDVSSSSMHVREDDEVRACGFVGATDSGSLHRISAHPTITPDSHTRQSHA